LCHFCWRWHSSRKLKFSGNVLCNTVNLFLHPENHTIDSLCASLCSPSNVSHFQLTFRYEKSKRPTGVLLRWEMRDFV
jgi:hypothetical protein